MAPPILGRAAITLGIGPRSSCSLFFTELCWTVNIAARRTGIISWFTSWRGAAVRSFNRHEIHSQCFIFALIRHRCIRTIIRRLRRVHRLSQTASVRLVFFRCQPTPSFKYETFWSLYDSWDKIMTRLAVQKKGTALTKRAPEQSVLNIDAVKFITVAHVSLQNSGTPLYFTHVFLF